MTKLLIMLLMILLPKLTISESLFVGPLQAMPYELAETRLIKHIATVWKLDYDLARHYVKLAELNKGKHGFPEKTHLLAIMQVESGFKESALHPIGPSVGLMQINASAHKMTVRRLSIPSVNVEKGAMILSEYLSNLHSETAALIAYNRGPLGVKAMCSKSCSTDYSQKVMKAKRELDAVMAGRKV